MAERNTSGLALGAPTRAARAELKRAIAAGRVQLSKLIAGNGDERDERTALGMRISDLLDAEPRTRGQLVAIAVEAEILDVNARLRYVTTVARHRLAAAIERKERGA